MTITEICLLMTNAIPQDFASIAKKLSELDTQTALEIITKYNEDIKMSEKELNEEIRKQTIRRCNI